jgi:transposase
VGPISAAQVLVSWSYAGRLRSKAAFAAVAGASPILASSGQVTRHRLNRSGDRRLNRALHTIVLARLRDDPETRRYAARRRAEGKSARDIRRCLKRAVARVADEVCGVYARGEAPIQGARNDRDALPSSTSSRGTSTWPWSSWWPRRWRPTTPPNG